MNTSLFQITKISPMLCLLILQLPLMAVEIESKDGKKIEADILRADKETAVIRRALGTKEFSIKRDTLSDETNRILTEFIVRNNNETIDTTGLTKIDIPHTDGGINRIWVKLPRKNIEIKAPSLDKIHLISGDRSSFDLSFIREGPTKTAESLINAKKTLCFNLSCPKATAKEVEKFDKENKIERRTFGKWEGFLFLPKPSGQRDVCGSFSHDGWIVSAFVRYYPEERNVFDEKSIETIVETIRYEKIPKE